MTCEMWHVTHDTWHVTHDTWHVTHDTWHVTHRGWWTLSQNFSSLDLTVWELWFLKIWRKRMTEWMNEWINDKAVFWTAPATPGLLKTKKVLNYYILYWRLWWQVFLWGEYNPVLASRSMGRLHLAQLKEGDQTFYLRMLLQYTVICPHCNLQTLTHCKLSTVLCTMTKL